MAVLSDGRAVLVSTLVWPAVSVGAGWWFSRMGPDELASPGPLTELRPWERSGASWDRLLRVSRWKDTLPDAGDFFSSGTSKRHLPAASAGGLEAFRLETLRAERVHWTIMGSAVLHVAWCRPAVASGMVLFGVLFNAPFIIVQRYNRGRIERTLRRRSARTRRRTSVALETQRPAAPAYVAQQVGADDGPGEDGGEEHRQ